MLYEHMRSNNKIFDGGNSMTVFRGFPGSGLLDIFEFDRMRNQMDTFLKAMRGGIGRFRENYTGVFPLINITEDDDNLIFAAELPGIKAEDLEITIKGDVLSLKGEKKVSSRPEDAHFYRRERAAGIFRRSLNLSTRVDPDRSEAVFKNGVLTITIPKAPEAKGKQVEIKSE
jgi:HSP20 family protein